MNKGARRYLRRSLGAAALVAILLTSPLSPKDPKLVVDFITISSH